MKLNFTIIVFLSDNTRSEAEKNELENKLKTCVRNSGATIYNWIVSNFNVSYVNPVHRGKSKPAFGELFFEVHCEAESGHYYQHQPFNCYASFRNAWFAQVLHYFPVDNKPLISLNSYDAFCRVRNSSHPNVSITKLSFGTMVTPTDYAEHSVVGQSETLSFLSHLNDYEVLAHFLHDSSELRVDIRQKGKGVTFVNRYGQRKNVFHDALRLSYSAIKQIIVNNQNVFILELINPPTLYYGFKRVVELQNATVPKDVIGRSNAISFTFSRQSDMEEILSRMHDRCKRNGTPIFFTPFSSKPEPMPSFVGTLSHPNLFGMDFSCVYLIEALIRRNCKLQLQQFQEFLQEVRQAWIQNRSVAEETLSELVRLVDTGHSHNYLGSFKVLHRWHLKLSQNAKMNLAVIPLKTMKIRRAIVTPTRLLLWPPEICIKNRIIRNFDHEFALRVSFRDEDYNRLNFRSSVGNNVINETIRNSMLPGISIGDRHFDFLAWSNSQIRDHGVWMFAMDKNGNSASSIRSWMGDFSQIRCVPKYMARMGQCFSQTEDAGIKFHTSRVTTVMDIERGFNPEDQKPYCFSDGIGRISKETVSKILSKADVNINSNPSAFQVRFGGKKGMLVLDPTLTQYDIVFRKSMDKFPCNSDVLEICKISSAIRVNLNRPLITILNQNGIKNHVFLRLQEDALQILTDMFFDDKKAAKYLSGHQSLNLHLDELVRSGISPTVEPFLRGMLLAAHLTAVDKILTKASLPIDPTEGRNMFGVLDETGILNYGEVFVQYTTELMGKDSNTQTTVLTGPVMVTKNPCYQGGDVRMFRARHVPALSHIKDCIVFPKNGNRPHPNEMAGSDLDGDEYTVIWKDDLIIWYNKDPSHFPVPKNELLTRPIQVFDMIDFLCNYIGSDNIGMLANTHLAFADSDGIDSEVCKKLARKCSIALDFAKNGEKVELTKGERPEKYPDFMRKSDKVTYRSRKSLGVLYRTCNTFCEYTVSTSEVYTNITCDPYLELEGWRQYKDSAIRSKDQYNNRLETILMTYGIKNESEAISGCFSKLHSRYSQYKDRGEIEDLIKLTIEELARIMKNDFMEEFVNYDPTNIHNNVLCKASAWYMVTYTEENPRFLSFPWIVDKFLCQIKLMNLASKNQKVSINPVLEKFSLKLNTIHNQLPLLRKPEQRELRYCATEVCPISEWEIASRMLIQWARFNIDLTNACQLNPLTVVKLLIHASKNSDMPKTNAITIIIMFLKFFMSVRFKAKGSDLNLPFYVPKVNVLAKNAMTTYRHVAITGTFESFHDFAGTANATEMNEMEPFKLSSNAKSSHTVENLKNYLKIWSNCDEVQIREDSNNGCLFVSAWGTRTNIRKLQQILYKGPEAIQKGLFSGVKP